jgi:hypothetical protein
MTQEKPEDATPQVHEKRLSGDRVAKKEKKSKKKNKALEHLEELPFQPADSKEAVAPHESDGGITNSGELRKEPWKKASKVVSTTSNMNTATWKTETLRPGVETY